jgi:hypothetical protein
MVVSSGYQSIVKTYKNFKFDRFIRAKPRIERRFPTWVVALAGMTIAA